MLALVSAVVVPQWVLLEQTHVYCTAGHHVASLSHSMHMLPTHHPPHLTGRQRIKVCACPQPYDKRRRSQAQSTVQVKTNQTKQNATRFETDPLVPLAIPAHTTHCRAITRKPYTGVLISP